MNSYIPGHTTLLPSCDAKRHTYVYCTRASLTPETERLLVAPLKVVMDHISEAFNQPRKTRPGAGRSSTERMVWGKEGLGSWVASLAEQVCTFGRFWCQSRSLGRPSFLSFEAVPFVAVL